MIEYDQLDSSIRIHQSVRARAPRRGDPSTNSRQQHSYYHAAFDHMLYQVNRTYYYYYYYDYDNDNDNDYDDYYDDYYCK